MKRIAGMKIWLSICAVLMLAAGLFALPQEHGHAAEGELFAVASSGDYHTYATFQDAYAAAVPLNGVRTVYAVADAPMSVTTPIEITGQIVVKSISRPNGIWQESGPATLQSEGENPVFTVAKGADLTLENLYLVAQGEEGAAVVADGGTLHAKNITVSAGEVALTAYGSAGLTVTDHTALQGAVRLKDGAILDVTGYAGTMLAVQTDATRADGAVVTRASEGVIPIEALVSLGQPVVYDGYLAGYAYRARYTRAFTRADGKEEYGYGGIGVNVSQRTPQKLLFTLEGTDALTSASLHFAETDVPLALEEGGRYVASCDIPDAVTVEWSATLEFGEQILVPLSEPLETISVNISAGTYLAPQGTKYIDKTGNEVPMSESVLLPNDLAIDEDGIARFLIGSSVREVYVGLRAPAPTGNFGGALYDAYNRNNSAVLVFTGEGGYEYALMDADGNFLLNGLKDNILWKNLETSTSREISFDGLKIATDGYRLVVRVPARGGLPGETKILDPVHTLTAAQEILHATFTQWFAQYENGERALPEELAEVLHYHAETLDDYLRSLLMIGEEVAELKEGLANAFALEWRQAHGATLGLVIDSKNLSEAKAAIFSASDDYLGLDARVRTLFGSLLTEEEREGVIGEARTALEKDYAALLAKAREAEKIDLGEGGAYAFDLFGLGDDQVARNVRTQCENEYQALIDAAGSVDEMEDILKKGRAVLLLRAYAESRRAKFAENAAVANAMSDAEQKIGETARDARETQAYESMLDVYRAYAQSLLQTQLAGEGYQALYEEEAARVNGVQYGESEHNISVLKSLEAQIDVILAQAEVLRELQTYYLGLFARTDDRLSASDLADAEPLAESLKEGMDSIRSAQEDARTSTCTAAKIELYRTLAGSLLDERYALLPASASLEAIYQAAKGDLEAPYTTLEEAEPSLGDSALSAIWRMELRAYYDALAALSDPSLPEDSFLESYYETVNAAPMSEKAGEAYLGMLELYRALSLNRIAEAEVNSTASDPCDFRTVGEEMANAVTLSDSEGALRDALENAEAELDGIVSGVRVKFALQEYYERLAARDGHGEGLDGLRLDYVKKNGIIDTAAAAEKESRCEEGKLALYKKNGDILLSELYSGAMQSGSAEEIFVRIQGAITEVSFGGRALSACEADVDRFVASAKWDFALSDYMTKLVSEEGVAQAYAKYLGDRYAEGILAIEETPMSEDAPYDSLKEQAAYQGMLELYREYFYRASIDLQNKYAPLKSAENTFYTEQDSIGRALVLDSELAYDAALKKAESTFDDLLAYIDTGIAFYKYCDKLKLLKDGRALMAAFESGLATLKDAAEKWTEEKKQERILLEIYIEQSYAEFAEAHPVTGSSFEGITDADASALTAARTDYQRFADLQTDADILSALLDHFDEQVPAYANALHVRAYELFLTDYERKAAFEGEKKAAASEVENSTAPAEIADAVAALKEGALAQIEGVSYAAYSASGENRDPVSDTYYDGCVEKLKAILREFSAACEYAEADFELNAFLAELDAELGSYALSHLKEIKADDIRSAYHAQAEALRSELENEKEGSSARVHEAIPAIRASYYEGLAKAYAALLGQTSSWMTEGSEDLKEAFFAELLELYRTYTRANLTGFYEEDCAKELDAVALQERSDGGLSVAESKMDALLHAALEKNDLHAFYTAFADGQGTDALEENYAAVCKDIDGGKIDAQDGARGLASAALTLFAEEMGVADDILSDAIGEIKSAEISSLSAAVLAYEKAWLSDAFTRSNAQLVGEDPGALMAAFRAAIQTQSASFAASMSTATTLPKARVAYETALSESAGSILELVANALAEGLDAQDEVCISLLTEYRALLLALTPDTAISAAATLMSAYARIRLTDERLGVGEDLSLQNYRNTQLSAAQSLVAEVHDADTLVNEIDILRTLVSESVAHIRGERFLTAHHYLPAKEYTSVSASDEPSLSEAIRAYEALDDDTKSYLDATYRKADRTEYADFLVRLKDEHNKALFEGKRAAALDDLAAYLKDSDSARVKEARATASDSIRALRYVSLSEQEGSDYFNRMAEKLSALLSDARASLAVENAKEGALQALRSAYEAFSSNDKLRFTEAGEDALLAAYESADRETDAYSYRPGSDAEENLTAADAAFADILDRMNRSFESAAVSAVSFGVTASGDGSYAADYQGPSLWGIIENDGGMSANTTFEMALSDAIPSKDISSLAKDKVFKTAITVTLNAGGSAPSSYSGTYVVRVLLTEEMKGYVGLVVFTASAEALKTSVEDGYLVFETTHFSDFYLFGEREIDLWWLIFVLTFVLAAELAVIVYLGSALYKKLNAKETRLASCALPLLAVFIPGGAVIVSIVLAVFIVLAAAAIGVLLWMLYGRKEKKDEVPMSEEYVFGTFIYVPVSEERFVAEDEGEPSEVAEESSEAEMQETPVAESTEQSEEEPAEPGAETVEPDTEAEEPAEQIPEETIDAPAEEPIEEIERPIESAEESTEEAEEEVKQEPEQETEPPEEEAVEPEDSSIPSEEELAAPVDMNEIEEPDDVAAEIAVPDNTAEEIAEPDSSADTFEEELLEPAEGEAASPEKAEPKEESIEEAVTEPVESIEEIVTEPEEENAEQGKFEEFIEQPEAPAEESAEEHTEIIEEMIAEPEEESIEGAAEEPAEASEEEAEITEEPVIPAPMPEEYRIPSEELRGEVTATEVNALMQDSVAKTLIEQGERVATRGKTGIVNVDTLGEYFERDEHVTLEELKKRVPYFPKKATYVKVLARGKLSKPLIVEGDDFSLEAVKMIALTGGHVIRTRRESR